MAAKHAGRKSSVPKRTDGAGDSREIVAAEGLNTAHRVSLGETILDGGEGCGAAAEKQLIVFTSGQDFFFRPQPAGSTETPQIGMTGGSVRGQVDGDVGGPGDMAGIAGQAVTDVHDALHPVLSQDGGGIEARPGLPKPRDQIGKPVIAPRKGRQPAAGQPQGSGGVETVSGLGGAAAREDIVPPFADGKEIQRELV